MVAPCLRVVACSLSKPCLHMFVCARARACAVQAHVHASIVPLVLLVVYTLRPRTRRERNARCASVQSCSGTH